MLRRALGLSLLSLGLVLVGCKDTAKTPEKTVIPATADGTVKAISDAVSEGKLSAVWDALPDDYQHDIEHVVEAFAGNMDKEIWEKGSGLLGKLAQVLTTKQDLILNNQMVKGTLEKNSNFKPADIKEALTGIGSLLADLQGDLKTTDQLGKLNMASTLNKLGANIKKMEPLMKRMAPVAAQMSQGMIPADMLNTDVSKTTYKLESEKGDSAIVSVTSNGKTTKQEMVKVKGKWLPKELADKWASEYKKIDEQAHDFKLTDEQKQMAMKVIGDIEPIIDAFLKASNQTEFDAAIGNALLNSGSLPIPFGP